MREPDQRIDLSSTTSVTGSYLRPCFLIWRTCRKKVRAYIEFL